MLKWLRKGNNFIIGFSHQKSKVECKFLAFKNLKISSKNGQHYSQGQSESTNNVFQGSNET